MKVWLIKPATDTRDGDDIIKSRIGLSNTCRAIEKGEDIFEVFKAEAADVDAIICDECQFFTPDQIDGFRRIVDECDLPVLCFGLRTDFLTHSFSGSARLFEIADSIAEIKTICECGRKATVNARITADGRVVTKGRQLMLGGNDRYIAMCHRCWKKRIHDEKES
jgi:thymidine kinase